MVSKEELLDILDDLSSKVYYKGDYNQLTIDLIDELIPEFVNESTNNWETTVGALSYKLSTLLEVMDKSLMDYKLLLNLYNVLQ